MSAAPGCPLCGAERFDAFRFGLLRCGNCRLVVDRRVFEPQLDRQLNEEAFGERYVPERSFWVRRFDAWKNRRYIANLRRAGVTRGRLLEVGVGSGSFLIAARQAGFEPVGCDLSRPLAERVAARTGVPVHCGDLTELPRQVFDVICMHHVLEHVSDPIAFLREAQTRLAPGGVLHLAVPNVACWEAKLPGWNCYEYYHLVYFDAATLRQVLQAAYFAVDHVASHESFSTWLLTLVRTALGVRSLERPPEPPASPSRAPRRWQPLAEHPYRLALVANGVATWPLRWLQGRLGYGDELIAIARVGE